MQVVGPFEKLGVSALRGNTLKPIAKRGPHSGGVFGNWLFLQLIGVAVGALISAAIGRRIKLEVFKGPNARTGVRLAMALVGGGIMGFGARYAMGCTSGMALTGGATLALGSMVGMMFIFMGAYALAFFFRRQWL